MDIIKSTAASYDDVVAFGNRIFNETFQTLLPKLYSSSDYVVDNHYIIQKDNQIAAMVGSFKNTLSVLDETLTYHGIGTVSSDPSIRNSGFMKELMNKAVNDCKDNNVDLLALGGQRQRYEYYGFTTCSTDFSASMGKPTIKHSTKHALPGITFSPLADCNDHLSDCVSLYNSLAVHAVRDNENFFKVCQSWRSMPYVIFKDNSFIGYAITGGDTISELVLTDYSYAISVIIEWFNSHNLENLNVKAMFFQSELISALEQFAEGVDISHGYCFNVLNYKNVIRSFLKLKANRSPLLFGSLVIAVTDIGTYEITVNEDGVTVEDSDKTPDLSLPHIAMMRYLFSPAGSLATPLLKSNLAQSWFPIPIAISGADSY